jgi:hypothetical protein
MREALLTAESKLNQWVGLVIPNLVELLGGNDYVAPNAPAPPLNDAHMGGFFMPWG